MDLANTLLKIMPYNYASLYMLKHGLGELVSMKGSMQNKVNFMNLPKWNSFISSADF